MNFTPDILSFLFPVKARPARVVSGCMAYDLYYVKSLKTRHYVGISPFDAKIISTIYFHTFTCSTVRFIKLIDTSAINLKISSIILPRRRATITTTSMDKEL